MQLMFSLCIPVLFIDAESAPHTVLAMPALSPTMVSYAVKFSNYWKESCIILVLISFMETLRCLLPSLQSQGNIARWRKKEGDKVGS